MYFWRTKQQQEVDLVEEYNGMISGFEFTWNDKKKVRLTKTFVNEYNAKEIVIDKKKIREFIKI
jgi:uncharacterized protein